MPHLKPRRKNQPRRQPLENSRSSLAGRTTTFRASKGRFFHEVLSNRRRERRDHRIVERCDLPTAGVLDEYAQAQLLMRRQHTPVRSDQAAKLIGDVGKRDIRPYEPNRHMFRAYTWRSSPAPDRAAAGGVCGCGQGPCLRTWSGGGTELSNVSSDAPRLAQNTAGKSRF